MIVNRVGDCGLALGIIAIFLVFKSLDYTVVFALINYTIDMNIIFLNFSLNYITLICILLFIGVIGNQLN
jgi:NADH:ubiquinone oxidoreductase subunit 5 (subunit L)/multisubunit Na+/H+ antiporter MnhA subunit